MKRLGESQTVSYSEEAITNAIIAWSKTLTNGYTLHDSFDTRYALIGFENDPTTFFMLDSFAPFKYWGESACLPSGNAQFYAIVIIRVFPVPTGNKIAVAIHGRHEVGGWELNIHTFGLIKGGEANTRPCRQDERQVLDQILSTLRKNSGPQKGK